MNCKYPNCEKFEDVYKENELLKKRIKDLERKVNNIFNYLEYKEKEEKEFEKMIEYVDLVEYFKNKNEKVKK